MAFRRSKKTEVVEQPVDTTELEELAEPVVATATEPPAVIAPAEVLSPVKHTRHYLVNAKSVNKRNVGVSVLLNPGASKADIETRFWYALIDECKKQFGPGKLSRIADRRYDWK